MALRQGSWVPNLRPQPWMQQLERGWWVQRARSRPGCPPGSMPRCLRPWAQHPTGSSLQQLSRQWCGTAAVLAASLRNPPAPPAPQQIQPQRWPAQQGPQLVPTSQPCWTAAAAAPELQEWARAGPNPCAEAWKQPLLMRWWVRPRRPRRQAAERRRRHARQLPSMQPRRTQRLSRKRPRRLLSQPRMVPQQLQPRVQRRWQRLNTRNHHTRRRCRQARLPHRQQGPRAWRS